MHYTRDLSRVLRKARLCAFFHGAITAKVSFVFPRLACHEPVQFELYILKPATSQLGNFQTCYSETSEFPGFDTFYRTRMGFRKATNKNKRAQFKQARSIRVIFC